MKTKSKKIKVACIEFSAHADQEKNLKRAEKSKIPVRFLPSGGELKTALRRADLILDALLGTGFQGKAEGEIARAIGSANRSGKPVLAADIPSGLDGDTGRAEGPCIRAQTTVSFAAMKKGFLKRSAKRWTGKIIVRDIGFPKQLYRDLKK